MRKGWFALLGLMLWLMPDLHGEILGDVLAAHNVALDVLTVRERQQPITSFAVSAAEFPFLIAYYDDFSSDISHVEVGQSRESFAFDVRMEAEGFGEDTERYVEPKTVHYVCKRRDAGCRISPR